MVPWYENMTPSTKQKYLTYHNAVRAGPIHGHRNNMHKYLVKFDSVVFELCERTNRQTDRQTIASQYCVPFPEKAK